MSIQSKVQQIVGLAMEISESGIADVYADYAGHTQCIYVTARPTGIDYQADPSQWPDSLSSEHVYLELNSSRTEAEVIDQLDALITNLNALKAQKELAS